MGDYLERLVGSNLSKREAKIIGLLIAANGSLEGATLKEIASAIRMTSAAASLTIGDLENDGLVKVERTGVRIERITLLDNLPPAQIVSDLIAASGKVIKTVTKGYQNDNKGYQNDNKRLSKQKHYGSEVIKTITFTPQGYQNDNMEWELSPIYGENDPNSSCVILCGEGVWGCGLSFFSSLSSGKNKKSGTSKDLASINKRERDHLKANFDRFWAAYPRRDGKKAARLKFKTVCASKNIDAILADIERRLEDGEWEPQKKDRRKFIPLPATYLNQERWEDESHLDPVVESHDDETAWLDKLAPEGGWK